MYAAPHEVPRGLRGQLPGPASSASAQSRTHTHTHTRTHTHTHKHRCYMTCYVHSMCFVFMCIVHAYIRVRRCALITWLLLLSVKKSCESKVVISCFFTCLLVPVCTCVCVCYLVLWPSKYIFNSFNSMCVTWCCLYVCLPSASKHTNNTR